MRRKRRKQKKLIIILSLSLLMIITVGYAAFSTNLSLTAKGNIKELTVNDYIQDNLFLHLDGEENTKQGHNQSATTWDNLIDNGYNLTMLGFENLNWTSDNGLYFDGIDDYIDSGFKQEVLGNDITIDIVANTKEINNYRGLVGFHAEDISIFKGFAIQFNDNRLLWYYYGSKNGCRATVTPEQTQDLIDKSVEMTFIMSANNYVSIYINGKQIDTQNCTVPFDPWLEDNLSIARTYKYSDDRYFKGTIYNYKIYRKTLTEEEVKQNYKVNKQRYNLE